MTMSVDFTKKLEREAVRNAEISGRTRKVIAEDLGIGLSTLTRWICRNHDAGMNDPCQRKAGEDMAPEFKRLRCENKILYQERDILKKAIAF